MTGRVQAWVGGAVAGALVAALAAYLIAVGWDEADKIASVLALFVALAGLAWAVAGTRREDPAPVVRPSGGDGRGRPSVQHTIVNNGGTSYSAMYGNVIHREGGAARRVPPPPPAPASPPSPAPPADDGAGDGR
ncbi:hypothetical protein ACH4SP_28520 [Streptomyces sp. NPDC021093]|uniref:hypothetical protein n=1 Tax=Streptomyces sp. NPDC021093 TaxID=3365112 RepID=UPI0037B5D9B7